MSLLEYNIMKARHGRYADTAENRRLHRVGQEYGHAAKEDPEAAKKTPKGEEAKEEKRTYDTARKELSTVLSNKEEFIKKYGQDEFDKRVGALVGEARELRDTEHKAEADKDFEAAKNPPKPKDTRSKKEIRTERLAKYKEQLKRIQDKMNQEGESEESRKMGEALEAKWKAKISKLEAKLSRGKKFADKPEEKKDPIAALKEKVDKAKQRWKELYKKSPYGSVRAQEAFMRYEILEKQLEEAEGKHTDETNEEAGKRVFETLSAENRAKITNKLKEESERFIKDGMPISQVIGEVEEYRDNNIDFDEEIFDMAHDMGMKDGEVYWAIKHAANLEIKRLEALEKEAEKKPSDPMSELPERGKLVEFKMDNVDVKIENVTEFSSDGKDMYRVDISKNGRHIADVTTHVPKTIRDVIEKYGTDPAKTKGLVNVKGDGPRFESKKGLVIADIDEYDRADFERYSGTHMEDAVAFMNKVIDKTGFNGRAKLFYSGNAGWTLFDENEEKIGNLMYKGNQYGLEDATWGDGWVWKGWGSDWSRKLSKVVPELNVRPEKPRM